MRALIEKEKPPASIWDLKLIPGGLIDIEFIAQYLRLTAAGKGIAVDGDDFNTSGQLKLLGSELMDRNDLELCLAALSLYTDISQLIRLCIDGEFDPATAPAGLIEVVCRAGDCPEIRLLEAQLRELSGAVRSIFEKVTRAA